MYLNYDEYIGLGGTLSAAEFTPLELEAESKINYRTFNRLDNDSTVSDKVKLCVYTLISLCESRRATLVPGDSSNVTGQSNDGVSITYNVMSAKDLYTYIEKEVNNTINLYLSGLKNEAGKLVLYRGVYADE